MPESQQVDQPSSKQAVQVDPKSQPDPKDKKLKPKGSRIDRANRYANRYVKELGLKQKINFGKVSGGILGTCLICKKFNGRNVNFTVSNDKEVEDCIEQHINTENHQDAIRSEGITSSQPQSEQQQQPDISVPTENTLKKRVQRRINDKNYSTQIHIKKADEYKVLCFCKVCNEHFQADEYDSIDAHINAYHNDKVGQEVQNLQHDQPSQPSAQESYYPDPVVHDTESYISGSGTYVDPGRHLYANEPHLYGTQSHQGSHVY
uniref:C2H2-type domain-containing protein n=1 Tax=Meloidogyne floridensis TaxID=298350 RepID=A0A915NUT0_9BILA